MGIEIRKVPEDWEHPRDKNGKYKPMFHEYYIDVLGEWVRNHQLWEKGKHPDQQSSSAAKECRYYAEWADDPPNIQYYNPFKWSEKEANCFQVYENISEGTPVSPILKSLQEVQDWMIQKQGYERDYAQDFCKTGSAVTFEGYLPANSPLLKSEPRKCTVYEKEKRNRPKR